MVPGKSGISFRLRLFHLKSFIELRLQVDRKLKVKLTLIKVKEAPKPSMSVNKSLSSKNESAEFSNKSD